MSQPDGGPAFPISCGMSLRDWFAGMALSGIVASPLNVECSEDTMATFAFQLADTMIAQREAQP